MARTPPRTAFVKQPYRSSARRQSPGDREPDHTRSDDRDPRLVVVCRMTLHPAAPYAGMTQTGSMGLISAALAAPQAVLLVSLRVLLPGARARPVGPDQARPDARCGLHSQIEQTRPVAIIIPAPTNRLGPRPICAMAMR